MVKRKRPFGRCRCTLEDNIRIEQKQAQWGGFYWHQEPLKALVNMVMLMICTTERAITQNELCQI
jgi:hypothetical protein